MIEPGEFRGVPSTSRRRWSRIDVSRYERMVEIRLLEDKVIEIFS
jgi:hypothetical protein